MAHSNPTSDGRLWTHRFRSSTRHVNYIGKTCKWPLAQHSQLCFLWVLGFTHTFWISRWQFVHAAPLYSQRIQFKYSHMWRLGLSFSNQKDILGWDFYASLSSWTFLEGGMTIHLLQYVFLGTSQVTSWYPGDSCCEFLLRPPTVSFTFARYHAHLTIFWRGICLIFVFWFVCFCLLLLVVLFLAFLCLPCFSWLLYDLSCFHCFSVFLCFSCCSCLSVLLLLSLLFIASLWILFVFLLLLLVLCLV